MIVLAHRGLRLHGPENTLKGFAGVASAAAKGLSIGVELDVRATADMQLAVAHDDCVNLSADPKDRFMWMENWYESAQRLLGEKCPPLLHEVLDVVGSHVPFIDIDIKERGYTAQVVDAIRHLPPERISLSAHIPDVVAEARRLAPEGVHIGMSVTEHFHGDAAALVRLADDVGATFLFADYNLITPDLVAMLHESGLRIGAYTVNDQDLLTKLVEMGVDYPCTDKPEMAIAELLTHLPESAQQYTSS